MATQQLIIAAKIAERSSLDDHFSQYFPFWQPETERVFPDMPTNLQKRTTCRLWLRRVQCFWQSRAFQPGWTPGRKVHYRPAPLRPFFARPYIKASQSGVLYCPKHSPDLRVRRLFFFCVTILPTKTYILRAIARYWSKIFKNVHYIFEKSISVFNNGNCFFVNL